MYVKPTWAHGVIPHQRRNRVAGSTLENIAVIPSSALIEVADLHEALASGTPPVLLDVRWALTTPSMRDAYERAHIPGAHFVELNTELAGTPGPGRHPMPDATVFGEAMRRSGVALDRTVVVYDTADSVSAARCWWMLRYFGHPDVRVLNGGVLAWMVADLELSDEPVADEAGTFEPVAGGMRLLDADSATTVAARGVLLDARSLERYRGEAEPIDPVAGHIPGARSAPTTENLDAHGRFLDGEALHTRFHALGIGPGDEVGVYCGSGVTAAHEVLALAIAGIDAGLYVGSWSEWITDIGRPIGSGDVEPETDEASADDEY